MLGPLALLLSLSVAGAAAADDGAAPRDAPSAEPAEPAEPAEGGPPPAPLAPPAPPAPLAPPAPSAPPARPPPKPAERDDETEDNWIDFGHAFVEHRLFAPVLRVDRFFSDERDLEVERARSFLRWRNELRFVEGSSTPGYTTTLSASLQLPGLNKQLRRLRVEIVGQTRDSIGALFPRVNPAPGEVPAPEENVGTADAGVRFALWDTLRIHGDLGAGVLLRLPPGVYGRVRFRFAQPLGNAFLARQALTNFWRTDTRFGSTGSAEIERPLARSVLARLAGTTTISEVSRGFEWLGDLSLLATFRARLGAQLGASISGETSTPTIVDTYRVYVRLRRDFYRRWIFLEIEPAYAWPWTPALGRHRLWAIALRLEVQFQGNEAPLPPPTAPEPEPADPPPAGALPGAPRPR